MKKMNKLAINPNNKKYYSDEYIKGWEDGVKAQYEATKDAVEVVRCKDCKHWASAEDYDCEIHSGAFGADDYCSYGERKGGGAE